MPHRVIWGEEATADLRTVYYATAEGATLEIALRFVQRIEAAGSKLADFPRRGRPRNDIAPGLRSIPAAGSVTIYYLVGGHEVQIVRVIHARRDAASAFADE